MNPEDSAFSPGSNPDVMREQPVPAGRNGLPGAVQKRGRGAFSRAAFAIVAMIAVTYAVELPLVALLNAKAPNWRADSLLQIVLGTLPMYVAGLPVALLILKKLPSESSEKSGYSFGDLVVFFLIGQFLMYAGNLVGTYLTAALSDRFGTAETGMVITLALNTPVWLKMLIMVIIGPLVEEFLFRRTLIDKLRPYGEKMAVLFSALMFGLFHMSLTQFFYAFLLGLLFGYVYLKTGKLRYTAGLHMAVNFLGSVVATEVVNGIDQNALNSLRMLSGSTTEEIMSAMDSLEKLFTPGLFLYLGYLFLILVMSVIGLVFLCKRSQRVCFEPAPLELPKGTRFKNMFLNPGFLVFFAVSIALTVVGLFK